jgi:hypothetical protein
MFGKPEWFTYRVVGWGIAPKTWQGWVYILAFSSLFFAVILSPIPEGPKNVLTAIILGLFLADVLVIWVQMGTYQDERQRLHQLIIERNCSLAAVFTVVAVGGYQIYQNRSMTTVGFPFDPLLLVILGVMALTKLITGLYLRQNM